MPIQAESADQAPSIAVTASTPTELMWLIHNLSARHELHGELGAQESARRTLGPEIDAFWPDGNSHYSSDLVLLAHRSGTLGDSEPERFFDRLGDAEVYAGPLESLRSETSADRELIAARFKQLRSDAAFRQRYVAFLRKIWAEFEADWNAQGRVAVAAEVREWERSLKAGIPYMRVLRKTHLWKGRPDLDEMADAASLDGKLILTPCWYGGSHHILEIGGVIYVGRGIRFEQLEYRKVAAEVASSIKALADPTRLAILLWLARRSASVTELADHFDLSQPTISAHVAVLRAAGLLDERTAGRSAKLSASEEGVRRLLSNTEQSLVSQFRG